MTPEDEAFDDLARKQGMWGGGFNAKRQAAMDKINSHFDEAYKKMHEDRAMYGTSWSKDGERIDPTSVYLEELAQEPYDQTALELCGVCGWKTLIPDDGCLNCERAQPAQEPVAMYGRCPMCGAKVVNRERRLNGNDLCASGHIYPSRDSTTPPKREWVGLTDEEREQHRNDWHSNIHDKEFYAIEAKLKEKNL